MITSKDNKIYKSWLKLSQKKYRQKEQLFLIEGEHLILEAKKAGVLVEVLLCEGISFNSDAIDAPVTYLARSLFEKLTSTVTSAGMMGVCSIKEREITSKKRLLLVDNVQDPGNLGTLIRSALAFGFDGMVISEDTVDIYNEKVVRATQGALFNLPILRRDLLSYVADLQKSGVKIYGTALNTKAKVIDEMSMDDYMAFIVGNEGAGVKDSLIAVCDECVIIQMASEVESLNVGVAGSILMHQFNDLK